MDNQEIERREQLVPSVKSRGFRAALFTLVTVILVLAVFQVGVLVGYRKASYSFQMADNYHRMFNGPRRGGMFQAPPGRNDFMDAHGLFGTVLKTDGGYLIIKDKDETEKTILVTSGTTIRRGPESIELDDITPRNHVVIIGEPDPRGQIDATLIRILP